MRWTGARTRTYWRYSRGASNASERLARKTGPHTVVTSLTSQHGELAAATPTFTHWRRSGMGIRTDSMITAVLEGGPLDARRVDADVVEGRPAKTIDVPADDGTTCRYCLAEWVQSGQSAAYSFLYRV
jgi:hypothetical protein